MYIHMYVYGLKKYTRTCHCSYTIHRLRMGSLRLVCMSSPLTVSQRSGPTLPGTPSTALCWRQRDWPYSSGERTKRCVCVCVYVCVCVFMRIYMYMYTCTYVCLVSKPGHGLRTQLHETQTILSCSEQYGACGTYDYIVLTMAMYACTCILHVHVNVHLYTMVTATQHADFE